MKQKYIVQIFTLLILAFSAFLGCNSNSASTSPDQRLEMIDLINQERTANGLTTLTHNLSLSNAAQAHADDMVARNFLSHTNPDGDDFFARVTDAGIAYSGLGENVSAGYHTMTSAHDAFMNSTVHRDNILRLNIDRIGVGFAIGTSANDYGESLYICVLFLED